MTAAAAVRLARDPAAHAGLRIAFADRVRVCGLRSGPCVRASRTEGAFQEFGLPKAMRSDNGPPFASNGAARLSRLSVWWLKLGIALERIAPGKPDRPAPRLLSKKRCLRFDGPLHCGDDICYSIFRDEDCETAKGVRVPGSRRQATGRGPTQDAASSRSRRSWCSSPPPS